jgi:hypothetical protein
MLKLSLLIQLTDKVTAPVRRIRTGIKSMADGAAVDLRRVDSAMERLTRRGKTMTKIGAGLSLGLTAPLVAFSKRAFTAASDAVEMESAFQVTFGNAAAAVRRWAEETGNLMGRSTQEMMGMAASFQDILKKQMDPAAAVQMSKRLTVLTQDLASFKNLTNEDAKQKIFSGLIGEAEPLRSVGVLLSENAVQAKAMQMGLAKSSKGLSEGAKVQARAALIMEQLADANDDVIRTSGSTANQIKRSQAAYEELEVTVGTKLLPKLTPMIEKLGSAIDKFNALPAPVQNTALALGALAIAAGPVTSALGLIQVAAGALLPRIVALGAGLLGLSLAEGSAATGAYAVGTALRVALPWLAGISLAIAGVYYAWKHWDQIVPFLKRVWEGIKSAFKTSIDAIWNMMPGWMKGILSGAKFALNIVGKIAGAMTGGGSQPQGVPAAKMQPRGAPIRQSNSAPLVHRTSTDIRQRLDIRVKAGPGLDARPSRMQSSDRRAVMNFNRGPLVTA